MPIVLSPCTFEWPRTGQVPAPGLPMLPRTKSKLTISLDAADRVVVLRQTHRPANDHPLVRHDQFGGGADSAALEPALPHDSVPVLEAQVVQKPVEALRFFLDKGVVEHFAGPLILFFQQLLHDAF